MLVKKFVNREINHTQSLIYFCTLGIHEPPVFTLTPNFPHPELPRNALGQPDPVIVSHGRYRALGRSEAERQEVYRGLFTVHVDGGQLTQIREAWQTGTPLGNDRFKAEVEAMLGRKIGPARRGRPKKTPRKGQ